MAYIVKQPVAGGKTHIHLAENHYVSEKRSPRQVRTYLGVLDSETNELVLGTRAPEPSDQVIKLLAAKGVTYSGKRSTGPGRKRKRPLPHNACSKTLDDISMSTVKEVGRVAAFESLAEESGLRNALFASFDGDVASRLLAVSIFLACDGAPMYMADSWADDVGIKGLSSSSVSRLCAELGENDCARNRFFEMWIKACDTPTSLIHDTTSISTYSQLLEDAEWGYNRDGDRLPQINIALVVSRETRLPLWFRPIPGSIPDVSTLKLTCQTLEALGLTEFTCSLDRGYFSRSNVSAMLKEGIGFIIGVPLTGSQAKKIVAENRHRLDSIECSFLWKDKRLRHLSCRYQVKTDDGEIQDLPCHLYLDPERAELVASRIETSVLELEMRAQKEQFVSKEQVLSWVEDNAGKFSTYLNVEEVEGAWRVTRNLQRIHEQVNRCGLTLVLVTAEDLKNAEVLEDYRCRDIAEKFFDISKNSTGGGRLRTGSSTSVQGRLFTTFIALILRCSLEKKLREKDLLKKYTLDEALALLRKIRSVKLPDGQTLPLEIPKKTREVAEAIGMEL